MKEWLEAGQRLGWTMPAAPWWKRLPVIRHARAVYGTWRVEQWYRYGPGSIGLRTGYDEWALWGIFHGMEQPLP